VFHDAGGRVMQRVTIERDVHGRVLREEMRSGEGGVKADVEAALLGAATEAPEAAEMIAQLFGGHNAIASTAYVYDADRRLVERVHEFCGLSKERSTYRYDDRGNRIEEIHEESSHDLSLDEQGSLARTNERSHRRHLRFDLTYDNRGNWIEKMVWT